MSDFIDLLRDVPPELVATWGSWLSAGLLLVLWHTRAGKWEKAQQLIRIEAQRSRTRSGVRPASGVRRAPKAPTVDAFGELEALLEPASSTGSLARRPGD
jgi:hypothetical protein